ncbi:MAG TPA: hypothetical protein VEP50_16415 [bacterium]|nr:hypothetical protein [bacterium]
MTRCVWVALAIAGLLVGCNGAYGAAAAPADENALQSVFGRLLGDPPVLRLNAVFDPQAGDYERINIYAEGASIQGLRIDQLWIRLLGATVDAEELHRGAFKLLDVRDSAIYGRVATASVEDFLDHESTVKDAKLSTDGDSTAVEGTVVYNGLPTHVQMRGVFQVYGQPEVFFHVQSLVVDSVPMPPALADQFERQINPVLDFRGWPVAFPLRAFHQTGTAFVLSSQADLSQPCDACGGAPVQLKP